MMPPQAILPTTLAFAWEARFMAENDVQTRLERFTDAMDKNHVPYALVGGQAVALWVGSRDQSMIRTTKDVDALLDKKDLPAARAAARSIGMHFYELMGIGMFLEDDAPSPKHAVHLIWAGEPASPRSVADAPLIDDRIDFGQGRWVVTIPALVRMKLDANRAHDLTHLRDMIDVGLIDRSILSQLPEALHARITPLLDEAGY